MSILNYFFTQFRKKTSSLKFNELQDMPATGLPDQIVYFIDF